MSKKENKEKKKQLNMNMISQTVPLSVSLFLSRLYGCNKDRREKKREEKNIKICPKNKIWYIAAKQLFSVTSGLTGIK